MNTVFFLGETINGENPATSLEIESAPKVKPQNSKMISRQHSLSLSCPSSFFSLSYVLQLNVSECMINREAHSLFILIPDLTITYQGRLLQESLITLGPHNCRDFNPRSIGGLPTMNLHDLFTLLNLPIGTSGHDMTQPLLGINIRYNT